MFILYALLMLFSASLQGDEEMKDESTVFSKDCMQALCQQFDLEDRANLFQFWDSLSLSEQTSLFEQLAKINFDILREQKELIRNPPAIFQQTLDPFLDFAYTGNIQDQIAGKKRIKAGQMGCIVLAGGQGSRLGFTGPKGMYPVSVIKQKSLFQLCAEKVAAASKQAERPLSLAIMTSPQNDRATRQFFEQNQFFGLDPQQIDFFIQCELPLLTVEGHLFLDSPYQIAEGSDGNGRCLKAFVEAGIWEKWMQKGVRYMNVVLVDNPLADPFDPELLGFHCRCLSDVTLKCTEKRDAAEKIGVLVKKENKCFVVEYSELSETEKNAWGPDGHLKHRCGSLSMFCFSMNFVQRAAAQSNDLPLHLAWKSVKYADANGKTHISSQPNAWKFETFIFDLLKYTDRISTLLYQRHQCFSPLKNATGLDSPQTVQAALQHKDREIIRIITGLEPPQTAFELAADFYYPTTELLKKWQNKAISGGYIEP